MSGADRCSRCHDWAAMIVTYTTPTARIVERTCAACAARFEGDGVTVSPIHPDFLPAARRTALNAQARHNEI